MIRSSSSIGIRTCLVFREAFKDPFATILLTVCVLTLSISATSDSLTANFFHEGAEAEGNGDSLGGTGLENSSYRKTSLKESLMSLFRLYSMESMTTSLVDDVGDGSPDSEFLIFAHFDGLECRILGLQKNTPNHLAETLHSEFPVDHGHYDLTV